MLQKLKSLNKKKLIIIVTGVMWVNYCAIISVFGYCPYWIEEYEDGWYVMENIEDEQDVDYSVIVEGPFDKTTAVNNIIECRKISQDFRKTYGTIFNLILEDRDVYGKINNILISFFNFIMMCTFALLPLYFLYRFYIKQNNK